MRGRAPAPRGAALGGLLWIGLLFALVSSALAQDTGQVCVQSFADGDADGLRSPEESAVAHGISASLHNAAGVTIASLLLQDSPFAADGLLCFDDLRAGDYQISMRSNEFFSTTAAVFSASVNPGAAPMLLEFGVQPLPVSAPSRSQPPMAVEALARGLVGALILLLLLGAVGLLIVLLVFRRRQRAKPATAPSARGSPPRFAGDETDAPGQSAT